MATVPLSGTNITLLSGIPFQNDFKSTRWHASLSAQETWFSSQTVVYALSNFDLIYFNRKDDSHVIRIDKSIDDLYGTNYLSFQNSSYNNKTFYAFVTKLEYVQRNRTDIHFEIDPLQTWMFDFSFKPSYIVREHFGTSANPISDSNGYPTQIFHQDEGLDYGTDYDVVSVDQYVPLTQSVCFLVIACTQPLHSGGSSYPNPSYNGGLTPLVYYVHPFRLDTSSLSTSLGAISNVLDVLRALYTNSNAVNYVSSLYITDYIGFNTSYDTTTNTITMNNPPFELVTITNNDTATNGTNPSFTTVMFTGSVFYETISKNMGVKYGEFTVPSEPKVMMYPYCLISLEDFRGNKVDFKPEYINSSDVTITVRGSLGTSNKVAYTVDNYNVSSNTTNMPTSNYPIVSIETGLISDESNDVPIVTDMLSAYLQGNRNSIANKRASIITNGVLDTMGSTIGAVASAGTGNLVGALSGIISAGSGLENSVLKMQAINAKIKDINNQPAQLTKMGDNTSFNYGNKYQGVYLVKRQIKQEYINKLDSFLSMYGYKCNQIKLPNLTTRQNWNYVQTQDCIITGSFNNEDMVEIKSIFDKGITLWHTDNWDYTQANGVV